MKRLLFIASVLFSSAASAQPISTMPTWMGRSDSMFFPGIQLVNGQYINRKVSGAVLLQSVADSVATIANVPTLAALRTKTPKDGTIIQTAGYGVAGDGGGGTWIYRAPFSAADDSATNVGSGPGRWILIAEGAVRAEQFGAKGDGVTNDTRAMQKAVNYCGLTGTKLITQPYRDYDIFSTINISPQAGNPSSFVSFDIEGAGIRDAGIFRWKGGDSTAMFYVRGLKNSKISNVTIALGTGRKVVGWDIGTDNVNGSTSNNSFYNCQVDVGGGTGLQGTGNVGWRFGHISTDAAGDISEFTFNNCHVNGSGKTGSTGFLVEGPNTLGLKWYGGYCYGLDKMYSNQGTPGATQANGAGGGAAYFYGMGAGYCNIYYNIFNSGTYYIGPSRYEHGGRFLMTATAGFHSVISINGVEASQLNDAQGRLFNIESASTVSIENSTFENDAVPYGSNMIVLGGFMNQSSLHIKGCSFSVTGNQYVSTYGGTWSIYTQGVSRHTSSGTADYFADIPTITPETGASLKTKIESLTGSARVDATAIKGLPAQFNPIAGSNVTLTGAYPNITFNASGSGSGGISATDVRDSLLNYQPNLGWLNVTKFGAVGDSSTNNLNAFQAAYNAAPWGGVIYLPQGVFIVNGKINCNNKPVRFVGAGSSRIINELVVANGYFSATRIRTTSPTDTLFYINAPNVSFEHLAIENRATLPTAGAGIFFANGKGFSLQNIIVDGFYDDVNMTDAYHWSIDQCSFTGWVRHGVYVKDVAIPDAGDQRISNSWFYPYYRNSVSCIRQESGGGLSLINNKFNFGYQNSSTQWTSQYQYMGDFTSASSSTVNLQFANNSFENWTTNAIYLNPGGHFNQSVTITGNEFAGTSDAIDINSCSGINIQSNAFVGNGNSGNQAITLSNVTNAVISNTYYNYPTAKSISSCTNINDLDPQLPVALSDGSTVTWDASGGRVKTWPIAGNRTLAISNATPGLYYQLTVIQDGTGSRTVTWPSSFRWAGGTAPTLTTTAGKKDLITFYFDGTNYFANYTLNY